MEKALGEDYLTSDYVAETFHISRRTLLRWDRLKKGPPRIKIGRSVYYRRAAIEKWLMGLEGDSLPQTVTRSRVPRP